MFLFMLNLRRRSIISPKGATIRDHDIRVSLAGAIVAPILKIVVLKKGTFYFSYFSIRVSLVHPFMLYFRLLMEDCLGLVIVIAKFMVSL